LGECTLSELGAYADKLELEAGQIYRDITLSELVAQPDFAVEIDTDNESWLDQIVLLEQKSDAGAALSPHEETPVSPVSDEPSASTTPATTPPSRTETDADETVGERTETVEAPTEAEAMPATEPVPSTEPVFTARRTAGRVSTSRTHAHAVDILLDEEPLRQMQAHALSSMRREVAGVMVGPRPEKQPAGHYVVHVTDMIIARHTRMSGASVTYTPESWRYMNDVLAERYPEDDMVMLGWYHTHPGFGIFLSNMDLFIHTNFFTQKWHIAYVLDPVAQRSGFFCWDRKQTQVVPYNFPWPKWAAHSW
jgi:proteasome lid subunit RPN8/RPN11